MALVIIEVADKIDLIIKNIVSVFLMMFYFTSTDRGRGLLNSDFDNYSKEDRLYFLETMQEIGQYLDKSSKADVIIISVIVFYIFYLVSRFIIQKKGLRKNTTVLDKYSSKNNIVLLSKEISNIADSFRFYKKNYIFVNPLFLSKIIMEDKKYFIISHEKFHGYSFDSITKAIILSCYMFLPIFIITYMAIPFLIQYMKPIYGEVFNYNKYLYVPFLLLSAIYIYVFVNRKKFISSFFHYKEHLADLYASMSTKKSYDFTGNIKATLFHPSSTNRIRFLKDQKSIVSIDFYFYVIFIIYQSSMSYKATALVLLFLLAYIFIFLLKHLYITLMPVIFCSLMLFFSKAGWFYIINEKIIDSSGHTILKTSDVMFISILYLSYFISLLNKRRCNEKNI